MQFCSVCLLQFGVHWQLLFSAVAMFMNTKKWKSFTVPKYRTQYRFRTGNRRNRHKWQRSFNRCHFRFLRQRPTIQFIYDTVAHQLHGVEITRNILDDLDIIIAMTSFFVSPFVIIRFYRYTIFMLELRSELPHECPMI